MEQRSVEKYIIITSIFQPTEAVRKFAALQDYQLVVAGDKKTPADWRQDGAVYLDVEAQANAAPGFANLLPFNHYGRKMIGYLYAIQQGATIIIDTDDDNIPYEGWQFPAFEGRFDATAADLGFVNIYHHYSTQHIWPRGLPLRNINDERSKLQLQEEAVAARIGIWQGLADEDPDVDAIYRLTSNAPCFFDKKAPVVLEAGTICPFNSQNTAIRKELFPLLYLPSFVTFRFTDILRGLVAQPIMWHHGYKLGFTEATVVQKRNEHDYFKDYLSEVPMYEHTETVVRIARETPPEATIAQHLMSIYKALHKASIVTVAELELLDAWLQHF
jgi:hypothetical protein